MYVELFIKANNTSSKKYPTIYLSIYVCIYLSIKLSTYISNYRIILVGELIMRPVLSPPATEQPMMSEKIQVRILKHNFI